MLDFKNVISFKQRQDLPTSQALYCVCAKNVSIYVGLAYDLKQKFTDHKKFEKFVENGASEIYWSEYSDREKLERDGQRLINILHPILNVNVHRCQFSKLEKNEINKILKENPTFTKLVRCLLWEYIENAKTKHEAYEQIAAATEISAGWIARFDLKLDFDPGSEKLEKLYLFFTGETLLEGLKLF